MTKQDFAVRGLLIPGIIGVVLIILGAFICWTDSSLEFWLSYMKGAPVEVPIWVSGLFAIVSNGFGLMFNVITSIFRAFVL